MKKSKVIPLDFVIDKLTNSIENIITGDSFATEVTVLSKNDLALISKKKAWLFDWIEEYKNPKNKYTN